MAFGDTIQTATAFVNAFPSPQTSVTVNIAAANQGSLLVGFHFTGDADSQAPTGFSEAVAVSDSTNSDQGAIYYKIADGGETAITFTSPGAEDHVAIVREYEGPFESSPLDVTASNAETVETSTSSGTTGTTAQDDELVVAAITVRDGGSAQFSGWTNSFTEITEIDADFKAIGAADKVVSTTGTQETTASHNSGYAMGMIATFKKGSFSFGDSIQTASASANSASTCSVPITAATAGNLLVGWHFTGAADSQAPSGFSEAVAVTDGSSNDQGAIYYKVAAGGETSVVFASDVSDEHMCIVREYFGPWESSPVDVTATNDRTVETSTSTGTTGTTSQNDEIACGGITLRDKDPDQFSGWTNGFFEVLEEQSSFKSLAAASKLLTSTGTQETTASHDNAAAMGMIATFKKQAAAGLIPRSAVNLQAIKRVGNF